MTQSGSTNIQARRPSPEALLELADGEHRGKLKVFLGAAPGVGKTYAMLQAARAARAGGLDVVVGLVETHGRSETAALLDGLEVLARKPVTYGPQHMTMELDIDAALARKPSVLLVDELAHTNSPACRHPRRHQDVQELLDAGIDVWTTLNIQHLDGLSDVVSRITGITVGERVPDVVLERADEVVVVDITPDELIQRLREGKVYLPETAKRAIGSFFSPGNLTALRELALRRTADRVDDQMVSHLRRHAIEGPWPTSERILVAVGGDAQSETVVRAASRLATGLNATWVALHMEATGKAADPEILKRADVAMRLAESLGAETVRLTSRDLAADFLQYARRHNITQIVVGRSGAGTLARLRGQSLTDEFVHRASDVAVHVVTAAIAPRVTSPPQASPPPLSSLKSRLPELLTASASVAVVVAIGNFLVRWIDLPNLSMLFLTAVLFCALTRGVFAAIAAALLSFFAYNFFFIPPVYTFTIAQPHEFLALLIFLLVAVGTGSAAGRVRDQADAERRRASTIQALYEFSRKLSGAPKLDDVLWAVVSQASVAVEGHALVLLTDGNELTVRAAWPPDDEPGPAEWAAARWAFERGEPAGWRTSTLPNARMRYYPLRTSRGLIGCIGVRPGTASEPLAASNERALIALFDQAAVAIERALLVEEMRKAHEDMESERLRAALLSSISHDLRTPLASIMGAITSLRTLGPQMPRESRDDLMAAVEDEAGRMSRFVTNLLDMTRIEAGTLDITRDWVDVPDALRAAVTRGRKSFASPIELSIADAVPMVRGDGRLLEQVVFNLLDNANKYAGQSTPIRVSVEVLGEQVRVAVEDQGLGIPADDLERVFDKFFRGGQADGRQPGTGLGLAIARGVVEAMGGTIHAISPVRDGHGTCIEIVLPAAASTVVVE